MLRKIVGAVKGQNPTTRGPAGGNPLPREVFEVIALVRIANVWVAYVERRIGKDEIELPKRWHNLSAIAAQYLNGCGHYFTPSTSHSLVNIGATAGSNGILGGRSIIDPEGFPYTAKQTAAMERVTPRSEGGPTENDPSPNSENQRDSDAQTKAEKKQAREDSDNANFEQLEKEMKEAVAKNPNLKQLENQVEFIRDKEGLRIEIVDKADFSMFPLGTNKLQPKAQALLSEVAQSLAAMPNKLSVRGHTDSVAFASKSGANNWSLSAERAEATRSLLEDKGINPKRFTQIEGVADTAPYNPADRKDPRNRRISITVKFNEG